MKTFYKTSWLLLLGFGCQAESTTSSKSYVTQISTTERGMTTTTYTLVWESNLNAPGDICQFGNTAKGHQAATNTEISARLEEPIPLTGLERQRIKSIELQGVTGQFQYDDDLYLLYGNRYVMTNDIRPVEYNADDSAPFAGPVRYDWFGLVGRFTDNLGQHPAYCAGNATVCEVPPTETPGTISVVIPDFETIDRAAYDNTPDTRHFTLVTTGDNDANIDCRHGRLELTVTIEYEEALCPDGIFHEGPEGLKGVSCTSAPPVSWRDFRPSQLTSCVINPTTCQ